MRRRLFCSETLAGLALLYTMVFAGYLLIFGLKGLAQAIDRSDVAFMFAFGAAVAVAYLSRYAQGGCS